MSTRTFTMQRSRHPSRGCSRSDDGVGIVPLEPNSNVTAPSRWPLEHAQATQCSDETKQGGTLLGLCTLKLSSTSQIFSGLNIMTFDPHMTYLRVISQPQCASCGCYTASSVPTISYTVTAQARRAMILSLAPCTFFICTHRARFTRTQG